MTLNRTIPVIALASALTLGAVALASVAPGPGQSPVQPDTAVQDIAIHLAAQPSKLSQRPAASLSIYDSLGHQDTAPDQSYCDAHQVVADGLTHDFAETLRAEKVSRDGLRFQLWTSDLMGTWTALHHGEDGISCIVASGVDWAADMPPDDLLQLAMHEVVYSW